MRRILLFLVLILALSACRSDDNIEIRLSGQISGEFEATGVIKCLLIDGNKVPFLSFLASEEDDYNQISMYLVPGITIGNYQFTNGNNKGNDILFLAIFHGDNAPFWEFEDVKSGELTLTQLPDRERGWVEGKSDVVYPNLMVEGTFKYRADPEDAPIDAISVKVKFVSAYDALNTPSVSPPQTGEIACMV
jgi:hypothetical protein